MPRPATTIAEKKKSKSYRPSTHGTEDPPQGVKGRPEVPAFLDALQRKIFNDVCDIMEESDWLRVSDGETVMSYSVLKSRLVINSEEFSAAEFTQLRMLANELGLSPAARAKMPKVEKKKEQNAFDDLD